MLSSEHLKVKHLEPSVCGLPGCTLAHCSSFPSKITILHLASAIDVWRFVCLFYLRPMSLASGSQECIQAEHKVLVAASSDTTSFYAFISTARLFAPPGFEWPGLLWIPKHLRPSFAAEKWHQKFPYAAFTWTTCDYLPYEDSSMLRPHKRDIIAPLNAIKWSRSTYRPIQQDLPYLKSMIQHAYSRTMHNLWTLHCMREWYCALQLRIPTPVHPCKTM